MQHQPLFFLTILFLGISVSGMSIITSKMKKIWLSCCVFAFYYFAGRGSNDLRVYQSILDSISKSSIDRIAEDASQSLEIFSLTSLWIFRIFNDGAYLWHGVIVVFFFLSITFFLESVLGQNKNTSGIAFLVILPGLLGELVLNQSRQLLATSVLVTCTSRIILYIKNLMSIDAYPPREFLFYQYLLSIFLMGLAFFSHYSSGLISLILLTSIFIAYFYTDKSLARKIRYSIVVLFASILILYLLILIASSMDLESSLEFTSNKYSSYQITQESYKFAVESINAKIIQLLFFGDWLRLFLIYKKNIYLLPQHQGMLLSSFEQKSYLVTNGSAVKIRMYLYMVGCLMYILCVFGIYIPDITAFAARLLYYAMTIQVMSFAISLSISKRFDTVILLTIPFSLYTVIMILQPPNIYSEHFYFAF